MAKTAMKLKQQRKQKFSTREYNRCRICGRPHAIFEKYGILPCLTSANWHIKDRFQALKRLVGRH